MWGSGILDPERFNGRGIEFLAVRGPRSRALIDGDVPERYGDPGILLPMVYTPRKLQSRAQVGLMLHYREKDAYLNTDPGVLSIDVQDPDWRATVDRIASCEVLVSSALHGIIVAEAYGVPAVWIQPTDRHTGGEFKFHDYYEGTDRDARKADFGRGLHGAVERAIPPPVLDASKLLAGCPEPHPHHPSLG